MLHHTQTKQEIFALHKPEKASNLLSLLQHTKAWKKLKTHARGILRLINIGAKVS